MIESFGLGLDAATVGLLVVVVYRLGQVNVAVAELRRRVLKLEKRYEKNLGPAL